MLSHLVTLAALERMCLVAFLALAIIAACAGFAALYARPDGERSAPRNVRVQVEPHPKRQEQVMSERIHGYGKIFNVGHAAIALLLADDVVVEEKVDGSQISFGVFGGELRVRSKNFELVLDSPEKMFATGVATAQRLAPLLHDGWTYRGEYLQTAHHNHLTYDRVPTLNIVLFDINPSHGNWLTREEKEAEAARIGLEIVPVLFAGKTEHLGQLEELVKRTSYLGGPQIEGVVIKNYHRFGRDGGPLFGKHVREDFKEQQNADWKTKHKSMSDIRDELGQSFRMPARWQKAVQRLRESGELTMSPKDIGNLIKTAQADMAAEVKEEVQAALMAWAWPHIQRVAIRGLPEWWKQKLLEAQFAKASEEPRT
jgi:hypothetical protein